MNKPFWKQPKKVLWVFILLLGSSIFLFWWRGKEQAGNLYHNRSLSLPHHLRLSSPAFGENLSIPTKYTCEGADIHPPLRINQVPKEAQSLLLVVEDPDAPKRNFVHWLVFNLPPKAGLIEEGTLPQGALEGQNDFGTLGYRGPCPPKKDAAHHYLFKLYALSKRLSLPEGASLEEVSRAARGSFLDEASLSGIYKHSDS